jgi:hypothetical protein
MIKFLRNNKVISVPRSTIKSKTTPKPFRDLWKLFAIFINPKKYLNMLKLINQFIIIKIVPNFL